MFLPFFLFFLLSSPIHAQTPQSTPYSQYLSDYKYQYSLYQQAYLTYIDKKQINTRYNSPVTEADQINATKAALVTRNTALKTYLIALRSLLDDYKSANPLVTEKNQVELSRWENWLNEQNTIVSAFNNSNDIRKWASDFQSKYITLQQIIYTALIQHEINLQTLTLTDIKALTGNLQALSSLSQESQRWLGALQVKYDLITDSFKTATDYTQKSQNSTRFSNFYPEAKSELSRANSYLRDIYNNLLSLLPHD